ncbi:hypothetical protein L208DRAFT_1277948, partial [Tricholoma matsutake]
QDEKPKEDKLKPSKVARRLSARVGDFFKQKPKHEISTPAKVDEHPPKIDEPAPVAPLENPATDSGAPAPAAAVAVEEPKPVEPVLAATPVVAAAA